MKLFKMGNDHSYIKIFIWQLEEGYVGETFQKWGTKFVEHYNFPWKSYQLS